uniref:Uncharacterized protein n=1 Tax=Hyaloperonospora arabidopsidis (strain Emoy2) TaxID=559515 RepID=M4BZF5_HYAAE
MLRKLYDEGKTEKPAKKVADYGSIYWTGLNYLDAARAEDFWRVAKSEGPIDALEFKYLVERSRHSNLVKALLKRRSLEDVTGTGIAAYDGH